MKKVSTLINCVFTFKMYTVEIMAHKGTRFLKSDAILLFFRYNVKLYLKYAGQSNLIGNFKRKKSKERIHWNKLFSI